MKKYILMAAIALAAIPMHAQVEDDGDAIESNQDNEEVADGIGDTKGRTVYLHHYRPGSGVVFSTTDGSRFSIDGLVQASAETRHFEDVDNAYTRFRMRRVRVGLRGNMLGDRLRVRLGLDMVKGSETDSDTGTLLMDALVSYRPWGNNLLTVSLGQTATPTDNAELMMSSQSLMLNERSKITSCFATIREVGLFVQGSLRMGPLGVVKPQLAITDGDGPLGGKRYGGMKYGARVNWLPLGNFRMGGEAREDDDAYQILPKLRLGVAYSYADGVSDRRGGRAAGDILYQDDAGRTCLPDMGKLVADVLFKYRGFSLLGEYAKTRAFISDDITQRVRNDGSTSTDFKVDGEQDVKAYIKNRMMLGSGFNLQAGYMTRSRWAFALRYTHLTPDKYSYMNNNLYFNRHNFYDASVARYLMRNNAVKVQLTMGLARSADENRTPDGNYTYNGNEFTGNLLVQFKF